MDAAQLILFVSRAKGRDFTNAIARKLKENFETAIN